MVAALHRQHHTPWLVAVFGVLSGAAAAFGAQLVTDDATKIEILKAAFPNSRVSVSAQTPVDWKPTPWPGHELADALAGEKEYEVSKATDRFETAYSMELSDVPGDTEHDNRRVRFRVYRTETQNPDVQTYVALAHYTFAGIKLHPFCCEWYTRLFVLTRQSGKWMVNQTDWSLTNRAKTVRSFRLVDLDGDGREEILVEAENTGTGYARRWIAMHIFGIVGGTLMQLAEDDTLSTNDAVHTQYSRELDVARTRAAAGKTIFFRSTVYGTEDEQFPTPRIEEELVTPSPTKPN